jgi:hypothetical protein
MIDNSLAMLGLYGKDKITGFEGVIASMSFDLYGCVCGLLTPPVKDGKIGDSQWFDVKRLEVGGDRVMDAPKYKGLHKGEEIGAAEKPAPRC